MMAQRSSRFFLRFLHGIALTATTLLVLFACSKAPPPVEQVVAAPVETEVSAPEQLFAEGVIPTPNASWTKLQRNIGGIVGILPMTFGGLLFTMTGSDVLAGDVIDGAQPVYFSISSASLGNGAASGHGRDPSPHFVFAARMIEGRKARGILFDGDRASFVAEERGGMTRIRSKSATESNMAITKSGFLLVASSSQDLEELGPYTYRNLPKKPLPPETLVVTMPRSVVRGLLRAKLGAAWAPYRDDLAAQDKQARAAHGGRAPDFGDPQAILGAVDGLVQKKLALLERLESVRIALESTDAELRVSALLEVDAKDDSFAKMTTGDAAQLLSAPANAAVSILYRDTLEERSADADAFAPWLASVVGSRLAEADAAKLRGIHQAWAKGRGDTVAVSFYGTSRGAESLGASACSKIANPDAMKELLSGIPELLRLKAIREPLKLKSVDVKPFERDGIKGSEIELYRGKLETTSPNKDAARGPATISVAYSDSANDRACLALSSDPVTLLSAAAKPAKRLGDDPQAANMLGSLGERGRLVGAVNVLSDADGHPLAPLIFAWGKSERNGFARVQVTYLWIRELMRRFLKF